MEELPSLMRVTGARETACVSGTVRFSDTLEFQQPVLVGSTGWALWRKKAPSKVASVYFVFEPAAPLCYYGK